MKCKWSNMAIVYNTYSRIRWAVVLIILLYVLKLYLDYFRPGYVIDRSWPNKVVPGPSSANLLATNICSTETKRCYGVMDYPEE